MKRQQRAKRFVRLNVNRSRSLAKVEGIFRQNGSCHYFSIFYLYEMKKEDVPDNEEGWGLNLIQPSVRVGLKRRLWC